MFDYTIVRSNRKTVAIHITKEAKVEVRAPVKMSKADIDKLVHSKEKWINEHLSVCAKQIEKRVDFALNYGDMVLLQGKEHPIKALVGSRIGFDGESFYMPPGLNNAEIKRAVIQIYKLIAKTVLTQKVIRYAKEMYVSPYAVKINSAKTRWGSCSANNSINFSWRLVLAADAVIDYVVVHELAHIKEHNHSNRFWAIVAAVMPDYKVRQTGLKMLQKKLSCEDWS